MVHVSLPEDTVVHLVMLTVVQEGLEEEGDSRDRDRLSRERVGTALPA